MKIKTQRITLLLCTLACCQSFAGDQSEVYYLTEDEVKAGVALNISSTMDSCRSVFSTQSGGCCDSRAESKESVQSSKDNPFDAFSKYPSIEPGKSINYQGIEFECVADEPEGDLSLLDPAVRAALTKYEWVSKNIIDHCNSLELSLEACSDKIKVKN